MTRAEAIAAAISECPFPLVEVARCHCGDLADVTYRREEPVSMRDEVVRGRLVSVLRRHDQHATVSCNGCGLVLMAGFAPPDGPEIEVVR